MILTSCESSLGVANFLPGAAHSIRTFHVQRGIVLQRLNDSIAESDEEARASLGPKKSVVLMARNV